MLRYVVQRLAIIVVILLFVSFFSFMLIHLIPGNPAAVILGVADNKVNQAKLYKFMGLDRPLVEQYFTWLNNVLHGNLGTSFVSGVPVRSTIATALPLDGQIALLSQVMALGLAIPLAFRSARKPGGLLDRVVTSGAFIFLSIPTFVVITLFNNDLLATIWQVPDTAPYLYSPGGDALKNFLVMLAPAFAISLGSFVVYYRLLRADLITTYQEEFITMARSKGLSRRRIVWRHAFRPSSIALLSSAGLAIGGLVGGTFIIEFLTGIPGLGFQLLSAIGNSDYIVVQGIVLVLSTVVVLLNFGVDLLFGLIDPRISRD